MITVDTRFSCLKDAANESVDDPTSPLSPQTVKWDNPSQTLIFLDWDDTLFPTTEVLDCWGFPSKAEYWTNLSFTKDQEIALGRWSEALFWYLRSVCAVSTRVVIVTNAQPGWVESTVKKFAPNLQPLFEQEDGPRIVYACETLRRRSKTASGSEGVTPTTLSDRTLSEHELFDKLVRAKTNAMQREAKEFYSQYPGQTWKNIISVGDARYEHFAAHDVAFKRKGPDREKLRLKCIITPEGPAIRDMIYRLSVAALMWPAYVVYDGDLDIDMNTDHQLRAIAHALDMPELANSIRTFPITEEDLEALVDELDNVALLVHDQVIDRCKGA